MPKCQSEEEQKYHSTEEADSHRLTAFFNLKLEGRQLFSGSFLITRNS